LNLAYIAQREHGGEVYEGDWPALVDAETFFAAQRILADPARTVTRRPGRQKHLLSYLIRCDVCGEPLSAAQRHRAVPSYFCAKGYHVSARTPFVDEIVEAFVKVRLADPALAQRLSAGDDEAVLTARGEAAALRHRLDEFRDAAAAGELTPRSLAHVEAKLLADIAAAEERARDASVPAVLRGLAGPGGTDRYAALSITGKRQVIGELLDVRLARASVRGAHAVDEVERVKVTPREPE
jgi:hypothetical protein